MKTLDKNYQAFTHSKSLLYAFVEICALMCAYAVGLCVFFILYLPMLIPTLFQVFTVKFKTILTQTQEKTKPHAALDSSLVGKAFEDVFIKTDEGIVIHVVQNRVRIPKQRSIIFIHGFPELWYSYRNQLQFFSKTYNVAAISLRGYGLSSCPQPSAYYSKNGIANDIKAVIRYYTQDDIKPIVVANDFGSVMAWHLFTNPEAQNSVSKYVSISIPPPVAFMHTLKKSKKQIMASMYVPFLALPLLPRYFFSLGDYHLLKGISKLASEKTAEDDVLCPYIENYRRNGIGCMLAYYSEFVKEEVTKFVANIFNKNKKPKREKFKFPCLIVHGKKDMYLTCDLFKSLQDYCEQVKYVEFENSGHFVTTDVPEKLNQEILNFISD